MANRTRNGLFLGGSLVFCLAVAIGWTYAQPEAVAKRPELFLPSNSVVFAKVDGSLLYEDAYRGTAAYQALHESGLVELFNRVLDNPAWPEEARTAVMFARHLQRHGLWIGIAVDPPSQGPPAAWGVVVVPEPDGGAEQLQQLISRIADQTRAPIEVEVQTIGTRQVRRLLVPGAPVDIGWWEEGRNLVLAFGMNAVRSAIAVADGQRPNVSTHPLFPRYVTADRNFEVTSSGWLDFAAVRDMFGTMPLPIPGDRPEVNVNQILGELGLDKLNHVASVAGIRGRSLWSETFIDAGGPRTGLLSLLDQEAFRLTDLPPLPVNRNWVAAQSFDWKKLYDVLLQSARSLAKYGPPDALREIDGDLERVERELGFAPEKLLSALGNVHCFFSDGNQGVLTFGGVGLISLRDRGALIECLNAGFRRLQEETDGQVSVSAVDRDGATVYTVTSRETPFLSGVIAVRDRWVLISTSAQALQAELLRFEGKLPAWDVTDAITPEMAPIVQSGVTSFSIIDPADFYSLAISAAPTLVGLAEFGIRESGEFPPDFELGITANDIPPTEVVIRDLFPNVTFSTSDESGVHMYSQQSLPGIPLGGGGNPAATVAGVGVLTALMLPAVQQAREAARRAQSKNNLKQLGLAMHNYHDVTGNFPRGTIENAELEEVDERLSWLVSLLPYVDQAAVYNLIDQKAGFEAEANSVAVKLQLPVLLNPAFEPSDDEYGVTHYIGIGGLGVDGPKLPVTDPKAGMFGYDRVTNIRDIRDGTSNTLMIAEANELDIGPWGQGGKATIRPFTQQPYINGPDGIGTTHAQGMNALFGDGSVKFLSDKIDPRVVEVITTINGREVTPAF